MKNLDFIYGMIIGDGHISNTKGKNSGLEIAHTPKQLEYLDWKTSVLRESGFSTTLRFKPATTSGNYPKYVMWTNRSEFWSKMRSEVYSFRNTKGKCRKRITVNILKKCTLNTLMVWYLDDGYNWKDRSGIHLGTYGFTEAEQHLIKDWIFNLTGAELTVCKRKDSFYLRTYRDAQIFKDAIIPVFPGIDCMAYKLKEENA